VDLITTSGEKFSELVQHHKGHFRNPLNDEEIEAKFHSLTKDLLTQVQRNEVLKSVWDLEIVEDIHTIMESLKI
jgi:2-methylcitrate dehydratase